MGDSSGGTLAAAVVQLVCCMYYTCFNPNIKEAVFYVYLHLFQIISYEI